MLPVPSIKVLGRTRGTVQTDTADPSDSAGFRRRLTPSCPPFIPQNHVTAYVFPNYNKCNIYCLYTFFRSIYRPPERHIKLKRMLLPSQTNVSDDDIFFIELKLSVDCVTKQGANQRCYPLLHCFLTRWFGVNPPKIFVAFIFLRTQIFLQAVFCNTFKYHQWQMCR